MKSSVLRKLKGWDPQFLKDFVYFWGTPISRNNLQ